MPHAGIAIVGTWTGACCCHDKDDPDEDGTDCIPMTGFILTGSSTVISSGQSQGRLSDITIGECGHTGTLVSGTPVVKANSLQKALVISAITGCNIGTVIQGDVTHDLGLGGGGFYPQAVTEFQGRVVVHTEVDFGNEDDDPDADDGLNIYPPIPTVNGVPTREPTPEEITKSASLDASPTTTVDDSTSTAQISVTPPTSCLDVPNSPPDDFQLSANFTLGDVSSQTIISKKRVRAQLGLSVQDIVCNLQGWAENVGEALVSKYGRDEMIITSGFRTGTGTSQHNKGQATDIQFPNMSNQEVYQVSEWMNNNVPYDQLILEYGGNRPWIHSSFNRDGNRSVLASNKYGTRLSPGNYQFGSLLNMA